MDENALSHEVIGAAIEVHKELGPGLLEFLYEEALAIELKSRGLAVTRQAEVEVIYKGQRLEGSLRLDILVNDMLIVEVKSIEHVLPVHEAQLLSYLRLSDKKLGLLINFNSAVLRQSIKRVVNNLQLVVLLRDLCVLCAFASGVGTR
ncbi:MAG TPA: GxxExxY protein [Burkholderiales bacterium]|nr:GxxExxY protein [Burkholderiales bacterium]